MGAFKDNDAATIVFEYVFPWVGVVIGNMMYAAPWKDVLDASLTGDLGVLNPLPWAFMTGNCFGWYVQVVCDRTYNNLQDLNVCFRPSSMVF
jgi:hypothetical protein